MAKVIEHIGKRAGGAKGGRARGPRKGLQKGQKLARKPPPPKLPPAVIEAKKNGRPAKLEPDVSTLTVIENLASIGCVIDEIAGMLNVTPPTMFKFLKQHKSATEALERGKTKCRVSLRRKQFGLADKNATMAIFLGKNMLGQKDVVEVTNEDGPNRTQAVADDRARALELAERLGLGPSAQDVGGGAPLAGARKLPGISEIN